MKSFNAINGLLGVGRVGKLTFWTLRITLFNDGHALHVRTETVDVRRRMVMDNHTG